MSQSFNHAFRLEVSRLSRRTVKTETIRTRKSTSKFRRDIASLKRLVRSLLKRIGVLEIQEKRRLSTTTVEEPPQGARFSPRWVKSHRSRLGLSALDYGKLIGVSPLSVYSWEKGKSKPRKKQLGLLVAIRQLRKREALARLEMLGPAQKKASAAPRKKSAASKKK